MAKTLGVNTYEFIVMVIATAFLTTLIGYFLGSLGRKRERYEDGMRMGFKRGYDSIRSELRELMDAEDDEVVQRLRKFLKEEKKN